MKEYFPQIGKIPFEGTESKNPLAFHYYDAEKVVAGKKMKDWLRFALAWWHTLGQASGDQFGGQTRHYAWDDAADPVQRAKDKADAGFEVMDKLGIDFFCFHDTDLIEEGSTIEEYEERMSIITDYLKEKLAEHPDKHLLWGTANVFGHQRYMNGAATNPDFDVVARAAVQIKNAIDATIKLGGTNYVFWGGREGYMSLLNTDQKREKDHLARMLTMARDYARANGFTGTFLIEPKPMEPTKHQYDVDTETVIGFLKAHGLDKDFKVNIEVNHATLAGHTFEHELAVAVDNGMLGSIDANRGDAQNGWHRPVPDKQPRADTGNDGGDTQRRSGQRRMQLRRQAPQELYRCRGFVHCPHKRYGRYGACSGECRCRTRRKRAASNEEGTLRQLRLRRRQGV